MYLVRWARKTREFAMSQPGFFDLQHRYEGVDAHRDPLVAINAAVPFELFRVKLKTALIKGGLRRSEVERKSPAGRKPWDEVLIFKVSVLQALYNLSDEALEYQLRDRLSFMRFVGLGLEDAVPDAKTLWLYREALAKAGAVEKLFDLFDGYLKAKGYLAHLRGRSQAHGMEAIRSSMPPLFRRPGSATLAMTMPR